MRPIPADDLSSVFWIDRPPAPEPPLAASRDADLAVVGGGFTGLATALAVKERFPDRRVVVLEARVCGAGASGRNAGMALAGCGADLDVLERHLGTDRARRAVRLLAGGLDRLESTARRLRFDCAFERPGSMALARTARQARGQRSLASAYQRIGVEAEILEGAALRRAFDSPLYVSGFHVPGHTALVDPWKVVLGLRRAARDAGVVIHENTPVLEIREGSTLRLRCRGGEVRAPCMVLATNAYSSRLGFFRDRIAPVHVSCVVTAPLDADRLASLAWERRQALWEEGRLYHFVRLTPDRRVLIGGGGGAYLMGDALEFPGAAAAYARLERALVVMLPQLRGVPVTHRWSGPVGFTRDFLPSIGVTGRDRNIFYSVGYSGHGVAMSHLAADILCALYAGDGGAQEFGDLFLVNRRLPWLLREPLKWAAINGVRNGWLALDRLGL